MQKLFYKDVFFTKCKKGNGYVYLFSQTSLARCLDTYRQILPERLADNPNFEQLSTSPRQFIYTPSSFKCRYSIALDAVINDALPSLFG